MTADVPEGQSDDTQRVDRTDATAPKERWRLTASGRTLVQLAREDRLARAAREHGWSVEELCAIRHRVRQWST